MQFIAVSLRFGQTFESFKHSHERFTRKFYRHLIFTYSDDSRLVER